LIKERDKIPTNTNTELLSKDKINELALFAGAGGGLLASGLLGWRTACAVEIEPYAIAVLTQRQNEGLLSVFPIWDNIRTFRGEPWRGIINLVSGGFPCQAFSTATHGKSTADDLWPEMYRVIQEIRPKLVFAENVSIKAITKAATDCRKSGYRTKTLALSAADMGADHNRSRYWLIAYSDDSRELLGSVNVQTSRMQELYPSIWQEKPEGWTKESVNERHGLKREGQRKTKRGSKVVALRSTPEPTPESNRSRMADGLAPWMDRYFACGNGQIPSMAVAAFLILCYSAGRSLKGDSDEKSL
jgi:DNA (cytosine-5)-methyltransferase 1